MHNWAVIYSSKKKGHECLQTQTKQNQQQKARPFPNHKWLVLHYSKLYETKKDTSN